MPASITQGAGAARWNDYLSMGNVQVGMRVTEIAAQTVATRYFHTDHLGSVAVITNESAVVVERLSFDAWGKRREKLVEWHIQQRCSCTSRRNNRR